MRKVRTHDVESYMGPASVKRPLAGELGTESLAINYFELEPGESFAFGYHSHADQEEVFYVVEGTAVFETGAIENPAGDDGAKAGGDAPTGDDTTAGDTAASDRAAANGGETADDGEAAGDGEAANGADIGVERVTVGAGEAVRFAPGESQQGRNESGERVVALALGAPKDAGETDIRRECVSCSEFTSQEIDMTDNRDALVTRCVACDTETGRFG